MRLLVNPLQHGRDVALAGIGKEKSWKWGFWITTQIFPFLFKALLFIHFFLQQQITEAVLKIKVLFSCSCKKNPKSAQNLNDSTKRSVNMPCKWWERDITVGKSILPFSIMKTSQYFYISELYHIIWNYIYIYKKRWKKMNTCFLCFWLSSVFFANERYKHINLLNIFISATLFLLSPRYSILFL